MYPLNMSVDIKAGDTTAQPEPRIPPDNTRVPLSCRLFGGMSRAFAGMASGAWTPMLPILGEDGQDMIK
jgi:hypothetical protein